jgi:hypothetical protein
MGVYFTVVGLDKADKLASVIGAFIGIAGLSLAIYGTITALRSESPQESPSRTQAMPGSVHNEIHGGTHQGPIIQGRDFGHVDLGSPPSRSAPPSDGPTRPG